MLEKLTKEQIDLMPIIRDKWISNAFTYKELTIDEAKKHVEFLYHKLPHPPKCICIADSMFSAQIIANIFPIILNNLKLKENIRDSVGDSVVDSVWDSVWDSVVDSVRASVVDSVRASVRNSVRDSVWDSVRASVGNSVGDSIKQYFNFCWIGNGGDASWVSFYDYFRQIKVLDNKDFDKYCDLLQAGIFETILFEDLAILVKNPKEVKLFNNRAHCEDGPSVKWADGTEYYFWKGIMIPDKWITEKDKLTFDDFIKEKNIEKRRCLAEIIGYDKLLDKAELICEKTPKGNELYRIRNAINDKIPLVLLKYQCPSTGRVYCKPVNPMFIDADEAQAWSFHLAKQDYYKIEVEA